MTIFHEKVSKTFIPHLCNYLNAFVVNWYDKKVDVIVPTVLKRLWKLVETSMNKKDNLFNKVLFVLIHKPFFFSVNSCFSEGMG